MKNIKSALKKKNMTIEDISYENRIKNIEKDIQMIKIALMKRAA
jgi:hypothetical protein